tara:strand:- start:32 stop:685 length:654 start_codon:yes stop_codon:yes gene_type:complete
MKVGDLVGYIGKCNDWKAYLTAIIFLAFWLYFPFFALPIVYPWGVDVNVDLCFPPWCMSRDTGDWEFYEKYALHLPLLVWICGIGGIAAWILSDDSFALAYVDDCKNIYGLLVSFLCMATAPVWIPIVIAGYFAFWFTFHLYLIVPWCIVAGLHAMQNNMGWTNGEGVFYFMICPIILIMCAAYAFESALNLCEYISDRFGIDIFTTKFIKRWRGDK